MQEPDLVHNDSSTPVAAETKKPRFVVPVWVALAAMVLALVLAVVIIASIAEPLINLISPEEPDIPVPPGARLDEKVEESNYASTQWLYSSKQTGCEVALFFDDHEGVSCMYSPVGCDVMATATPKLEPTPTGEVPYTAEFYQVAVCTKQVKEVASSYSWRVEIFDGYGGEYHTKFRVYLFSER